MKITEIAGNIRTRNRYIGKPRKKPKQFDFDLAMIHKYFRGIKYRGLYYIEMKQCIISELYKHNFTCMQIGDILDMDYSSIIYLKNNRVSHPLALEMKYKWREFILNNQYPVTVYDVKLDKNTFTKEYETFYQLIDADDFYSYICNNQ